MLREFCVRSVFTLATILLSGLLAQITAYETTALTGKFLWFSDLHLDPYYGKINAFRYQKHNRADCNGTSSLASPFGTYGCDAPLSLIDSAIQHSKSEIRNGFHPDFILLTGDFCRHGTDDGGNNNPVAMIGKVLTDVSKSILREYPHTSIVPLLGNNDAFLDYRLTIEEVPNALLELAADKLEGLLRDGEMETFRTGGYYSRNVGPNILLIALNTLIYSSNHSPDETRIVDPFGQFAWLEQTLTTAASNPSVKVYIVGHIPPTIGSYRKNQYWHDQYLDVYFRIIERYDAMIAAQLYGHAHSDEFRVLRYPTTNTTSNSDNKIMPPLLMNGALTPVFGNNPNFRLVKYHPEDLLITDYDTYVLTLNEDGAEPALFNKPTWGKSDSFHDSFNVPDVSITSLQTVLTRLSSGNNDLNRDNNPTMNTLLTRIQAGVPQPPCEWSCRMTWVCTFQSITHAEYRSCMDAEMGGSTIGSLEASGNGSFSSVRFAHPILTVLLGVFVCLLVVVLGVLSYRFRGKRIGHEPHNRGVAVNTDDEDPNILSDEPTIQLRPIT